MFSKYLSLYKHFLSLNLMRQLSFRSNFWFSFGLTILESVSLFWVVTIVFAHIQNIAGWSYDDTVVLTGVFLLTTGVGWLTYRGGLRDLDILVNQGGLDPLLTKPIDTHFLVAVHRIDIEDSGKVLAGIALVLYGLQHSNLFHTLLMLPIFLFVFLCGQIILASIHLTIKTISFKAIEGWAVESLHWRFHDLARYPTDIYTGALRLIYTYMFPLIFIATVPTKALTGGLTLRLVLGAMGAAVISWLVSRSVWQRALRGYTSASS